MLTTAVRLACVALAVAVAAASVPPARGAEALTITSVLGGLDWPVALAFAPDGRWFFNERFTGAIRVVEGGQVRPQPWATLPVLTSGEQGLLGLALDPRWSQGERWVYAYHTYDNTTTGQPTNRVVRLFDAVGQGGSLEVLRDGVPAGTFHNGGIVAFAPDGTLFVTTGDAGTSSNAQNPLSLAGKILRMNPDGSVPPDNPFASAPGTANPYVYTLGHRNVFGIAFRPPGGQPFVTENGPSTNDEVNALVPGGNYGWPTVLGAAGDPRFIDPVFVFPQVVAPTGAAFFTGTEIGNLSGDLVFGDWLRGDLHRLRFVAPGSDEVLLHDILATSPEGGGGVLDVDDGPDGFLYVTTTATVYRVNGTASGIPDGAGGVPAWLIVLGVLLVAGGVVFVVLARRRTAK